MYDKSSNYNSHGFIMHIALDNLHTNYGQTLTKRRAH